MQESWKKMLQIIPEGFLVLDKDTSSISYANSELKKILEINEVSAT
jgi:hypothetical protein